MKVKLLVSVLCIGVLSLIGFKAASRNSQQPKEEPTRDRLKWSVGEAKRQGRQQVVISAPFIDYLGAENRDIEQAINDYSVVVAQPIEKKTYQVSDNDLRTWYRFVIVEALTPLKDTACPGFLAMSQPADIRPLESNEFLPPKHGGRLMLDGVKIIQTEPGFPEFENSQRYRLFLHCIEMVLACPRADP